MRLLILGGTRFLGRATAAHAVATGHEVTCAARGRSGPVAAPPSAVIAAGLTYRHLSDTARDTLDWYTVTGLPT